MSLPVMVRGRYVELALAAAAAGASLPLDAVRLIETPDPPIDPGANR